MKLGVADKNQIVIDTLQGTQQIEKFVTEQDLKADDLEGMIKRLQKVADKLSQQRDLDKFIVAVDALEALSLPISTEVKEKGKQLAELFTEDSRLDKFRPRKPVTRNNKKGFYIVGDQKVEGSSVGAIPQKVKVLIDAYNKDHGLELNYTDIRNPELQREDFKFV